MIFPPIPDIHAIAVLVLTVVALILFTREKIALETSSLLVLIVLAVGFELFPYTNDNGTVHAVDFFSGFGHEALVAVCALMIAGQGITRTGALEPVGRALAKLWKISPALSLLLTLAISAVISAFINNVPVVVLFLPILVSVSLRTGSPASSVLMPMGFATLLGGTSTTIGTSTNLLVIAVAADMGMRRFQMFDFLLPAAIAGAVGLLYLWLVAPRILPRRDIELTDSSPRIFNAHLAILEGSPAAGKTLSETRKLTDGRMRVISVERGENNFIVAGAALQLQAGDHLVVRDTPDNLKEFETLLGGTLFPENSHEFPIDEEHPLQSENQQIAEVVVVEGSRLVGRTISGLRFYERYGLITIAIHRAGKQFKHTRENIGDIRLRAGDVLLVQGPGENISSLKKSGEMLVLDATSDLPITKKAPLAIAIMAGIVIAAAFGILPIAISSLCGVLLMLATGCLDWRDATRALSTQVILIVVASLALGSALVKTGGAEYLAQVFVALTGGLPPVIIFSGLMLLLAVLTNIVSNNAAAVIGTPIAISIATQLGQPPELFVLAVLFGANMSFATPMAYKTNLLVMSAGEYRFNDFLRAGIPLTLLMWLTLSFVLPMIYSM